MKGPSNESDCFHNLSQACQIMNIILITAGAAASFKLHTACLVRIQRDCQNCGRCHAVCRTLQKRSACRKVANATAAFHLPVRPRIMLHAKKNAGIATSFQLAAVLCIRVQGKRAATALPTALPLLRSGSIHRTPRTSTPSISEFGLLCLVCYEAV